MTRFSITLRGRPCTVEGTITAADPAAGVLRGGVEDFTVTDDGSGIELVDLTDKELERIQERAAEYADGEDED
jgi:hypothetical protein